MGEIKIEKKEIGNVFDRGGEYQVPFYQRMYVWDEEQWIKLKDDMISILDNDKQFFMGSLIFKKADEEKDDKKHKKKFYIIDGQQRLTTLLVYFRVLFDKIDLPDKFKEYFYSHDNYRILYTSNFQDDPILKKILKNKECNQDEKETKLHKCYEFFYFFFNEKLPDGDYPNRKKREEYLKKIFSDEESLAKKYPTQNNFECLIENVTLSVIKIDDDEQEIFETLNSTGVGLTTSELLKNHLYKGDEQDEYNITWKKTFEEGDDKEYWDSETVKKIQHLDLLLNSFLFIKLEEEKLKISSTDKDNFKKTSRIFKSYKELIKRYDITEKELRSELIDHAKVYKKIFDHETKNRIIECNDYLDRCNLMIFYLQNTTLVPYILYLYKNNPSNNDDVIKYIESYLIRKYVCGETKKDHNNFFQSLINKEIRDVSQLRDHISKQNNEKTANAMPNFHDFSNKFNTFSFSRKGRYARLILYFLELAMEDVDMDAKKIQHLDAFQLEHIMPQKWEKHNDWKKDLDANQKVKRNDAIHTLGNLTLLTSKLNAKLSNRGWKTKKDGEENKNNGIQALGNLAILRNYFNRDVWDENVIKERTEELVDVAVNKVWTTE